MTEEKSEDQYFIIVLKDDGVMYWRGGPPGSGSSRHIADAHHYTLEEAKTRVSGRERATYMKVPPAYRKPVPVPDVNYVRVAERNDEFIADRPYRVDRKVMGAHVRGFIYVEHCEARDAG